MPKTKTTKKAAVKKSTAKKAPAKKTAVAKKKVAKKKTAKKVVMHANHVHEPMKEAAHICRTCHALPAGSTELVSLLLVLVFALSAVLMTSVFALSQQSERVELLEAQIVYSQGELK